MKSFEFLFNRQNRLTFRLLLYVILISVFFTLLATVIQLYFSYRHDLEAVEENVQFLKENYLPAIATSVYALDDEQLRLQLKGALGLPDITYLEVRETRDNEPFFTTVGDPVAPKDMVYEFPLAHAPPGANPVTYGTLIVTVSRTGIYQRFWLNLGVILRANLLSTFLIAAVIFIIFQFTLTRHLVAMVNYTRQLDLNRLDEALVLDRRVSISAEPDELHQLAQAINELRLRLKEGIAERKQTEEALQASEAKYRHLFNSGNDAMFVHGLSPSGPGLFLDVNEVACTRYGYSREEILAMNPSNLDAENGTPEIRQKAIQELLATGHTVFEIIHVFKDGSEVLVEINATSIELGGKPVVFSIARDITQRKQAEWEIQRRNRELALLNRIIAASVTETDETTILDIVCHELTVAFQFLQAGALLLNEQKTGMVVVAESLMKDRPPGLGRVVILKESRMFAQLVDNKETVIINDPQNDPRVGVERDFVRQQRRMEALLLTPLIIDGEVIGALGIDSPELRHFSPVEVALVQRVADQISSVLTRLRLNRAHRQLEVRYYHAQKMEAIGRLTGGVAHDFNNILTAIMGYGGLMLRKLTPNDPLWSDAEQILKSAERAASLTRQLLAFSRQQVLQLTPVDLNDIIRNLQKMLHRLISEDIGLETALDTQLKQIKADPVQLEQVIVNLVVNARDAMPHGGQLIIETANVLLDEVYARQHAGVEVGAYVMLAVSDTGIGMDSETQAHIFEPFFTTKEQGKGTGLGLATVHGIVKHSGGHIEVYSEPGHGTTFKIYLPQIESPIQTAEPKPNVNPSPRGWETILLVEDMGMVREMVHQLLLEQGYTVLTAVDGRQARQICLEYMRPIHLLLTDVVLPGGLNGPQLVEELGELRPPMKVLYMSGYTDNAIVQKGVSTPGAAFLPKPFTLNVLIHKVREVLDSYTPQGPKFNL